LVRRRARGAGSVFKRRDGRWVGEIDLGWEGDRHVRTTVYGRSRREAEDRIRAVLNDRDNGLPRQTKAPQLSQFLSEWLEAIKPSIRTSTFASYEGVVRLHLMPALGRITLDRLAVDDVARLVRTKQAEERLSTRSVRYVLFILRNALNKAVRWGLVGRNVATLVDPPRVKYRDVRVLSPEETTKLLTAARGDPLEGLVVLAVSTGVRLGEALGVTWADIDLERRQMRIDKSLQRVTGAGQVVSETKTRRSRRTIVLPVIAAEALRQQLSTQRSQRRAFGHGWPDGGFVFTSSNGRPLDARNVQRGFRRIVRRAKLPRMRFHDLRHSCASLLLTQGVAPRVVMETLGHSRIAVTMDTYTHVMPALQHEAADAIDRSLAGER
jgi:integrase